MHKANTLFKYRKGSLTSEMPKISQPKESARYWDKLGWYAWEPRQKC